MFHFPVSEIVGSSLEEKQIKKFQQNSKKLQNTGP